MKSLLTVVVVLSLTTIACTNTDEGHQANQSEDESRRHSGGGQGTGETSNNIPAVTGLTANATGPTEVKLAWNSVTNATTYRIYRDLYVPAIIRSTSYTDRSVKPGTTYTYSIAIVVGGTLGPKSAPVTVTTPQ